MDGVIVIDKPSGWTSHDVVQKIKRHFKLDKVGHAGTLDPSATGVLVLCVGRATRFVRFLPCDPKEYEAEMILGLKTNTLDITGEIITEEPTNVALDRVEEAFGKFIGFVDQVPPMVSAVKVGGTPLHVLARQGKEIPRKARKIQVFELEILKLLEGAHQKILFKVLCSKGTYVRTLCDDVGDYLGCGACLGSLVRTASGSFRLADALTVDKIQELGQDELEKVLLPLSEALQQLKSVIVNKNYRPRVLSGGFLAYNMVKPGLDEITKGETIRVLDEANDLLAVATAMTGFSIDSSLDPEQIVARPICVLSSQV